jgi:hypothetical protein
MASAVPLLLGEHMGTVVLIDADPIIYASGFAAQKTIYEYVYLDHEDQMQQNMWTDGNEALRFFREHSDYSILNKEARIDAADPSFACQAARTTLRGILRAVSTHFAVDDRTLMVELVLSGPGNFREKIATIKPYKGDRPPPPVHYQVVRNYLTERHGAIVVSGMEADDYVSIRSREATRDGHNVVVCTIDKDLDQVPGLHYNYQKKTMYTVNDADADLMFWTQAIAGDATDNIQGCYKVGVAKARDMLATWTEAHSEDKRGWAWDKYVWRSIVQEYKINIQKYPERYPENMEPEDAAIETARLVKMLDHEDQLWTPPGKPDASLSEWLKTQEGSK